MYICIYTYIHTNNSIIVIRNTDLQLILSYSIVIYTLSETLTVQAIIVVQIPPFSSKRNRETRSFALFPRLSRISTGNLDG